MQRQQLFRSAHIRGAAELRGGSAHEVQHVDARAERLLVLKSVLFFTDRSHGQRVSDRAHQPPCTQLCARGDELHRVHLIAETVALR